jgi:excinuclease ABC subunit C
MTDLKQVISNLPAEPGIYKYLNKKNEIIYVGKAKNLKKRVSSYFSKTHLDNKTNSLVKNIASIEFIVVNSETDALLLENNLIKEHQPKYNILMRDDKTYPYILLTNDIFPKIYATRKYKPELGTYFGPFASVRAMDSVMELIKKLFTIRNCDLNLTEKNIAQGKFKKCLEYHLGNCKAPCENLQSLSDYNKDIAEATIILKGDLGIVRKTIHQKMKEFSEGLQFEKAAHEKSKLEMLDKFQTNTLISSQKTNNTAVFTIKKFEEKILVNYLYISFGRIIQSKNIELIDKLNESESELLKTAIIRVLLEQDIKPNEIIANLQVELELESVKFTVPQIGDKRKLIDLSIKNLDFYYQNQLLKQPKQPASQRVLETLKKELSLNELPTHIECFDNSNLQGTTPVAAMSCFKNGVPSKKDYRHFNIKTVIGPNDFDSMREIVFRRYSRLVAENLPLPNLIVIDGGKGQLSAAVDSLKKVGLYGKIPIISIAKRLEEIYVPGDEIPLHLEKKSEGLRLIQYLRDEVHRFGITFHRKKRDKIKGK